MAHLDAFKQIVMAHSTPPDSLSACHHDESDDVAITIHDMNETFWGYDHSAEFEILNQVQHDGFDTRCSTSGPPSFGKGLGDG